MLLRSEIAAFRAATVDLDAAVPSCPGWLVRDVVHHLGSVHRTFARVADEGWLRRPPPPLDDDRPAPTDDGVRRWAEDQADLLVEALDRLDPAAARWNPTPGPQVGSFIPRRMHLETAVHRWDVELAAGAPSGFDDAVAHDGLLEYLEVYVPRSGPWGGAPGTLRFTTVEGEAVDLVLAPGRLGAVRAPSAQAAQAVVTGRAEELMLLVWGRLPPETAHIAGDRALLEDLLARSYR